MASKYELTISTKYVPDWTYVEAVREIFQNALDNEITNSGNTMGFEFNNGVLTISNKTSVLPIQSLLLGCSTKQDDANTIGKHGEGYKIAFMVLLREGKGIKVYNYGNKEIWEATLVKSRRFNGELVPTINVHKNAIWEKVPSSDLIIEVTGLTVDEFSEIEKKNLHIKSSVESVEITALGRILTDQSKEAGNIYVKGLFICHKEEMAYGYDFEPALIKLDRDRKLVGDFDVQWNTSRFWAKAFANGELQGNLLELIKNNSPDIQYIKNTISLTYKPEELSSLVAEDFIRENGDRAAPVFDTDDIQVAIDAGLKPVVVKSAYADILKTSTSIVYRVEKETLKERFTKFMGQIKTKLSDEELEELNSLIEEL